MAIELIEALKELHLPTVRACYEEQAEIARRESRGYEQYLTELMVRERVDRRGRRIDRMLLESTLPLEKTLENFDRSRLPRTVDAALSVLLEGAFLDRCENVLAFGNPGSGKTHLLCALGQELIYLNRRILFRRCDLLVQQLLVAKRELKLDRLLKRFARYDAILIDDIGYVQQSREEMEVLFTLLSYRYERGSVMLSSNLPFSKWETIFKDPMTTAAAIDRLVHHSTILELNISSYRLEEAKNRSENRVAPSPRGEGGGTEPSP
jgi:DNA replication protein DnaC